MVDGASRERLTRPANPITLYSPMDLSTVLKSIERQAKEHSIPLFQGDFGAAELPEDFAVTVDAGDEVATYGQIKNILAYADANEGTAFLIHRKLENSDIEFALLDFDEANFPRDPSMTELRERLVAAREHVGQIGMVLLYVSVPILPCFLSVRLFTEWYEPINVLDRLLDEHAKHDAPEPAPTGKGGRRGGAGGTGGKVFN